MEGFLVEFKKKTPFSRSALKYCLKNEHPSLFGPLKRGRLQVEFKQGDGFTTPAQAKNVILFFRDWSDRRPLESNLINRLPSLHQ